MSAGKILCPEVYVIGWAKSGIVKIGSTLRGYERYGSMLVRGGELIASQPGTDSTAREQALIHAVRGRWPRAFSSKDEARTHLPGGAGYSECFKVPETEWPTLAAMAKELT